VDRDALGDLAAQDDVVELTGDVADPDTHERALRAALEIGELVGWVNAAGIAAAHRVDEVTFADYRALFDVNFAGTLWGVSAAVRGMIETGGSIVSLSSTQAQRGLSGYPLYAAAKGAIEALTRQVAAEFAPHGIRCNAISPGVIMTPMNANILAESEDPDALAAYWDSLSPIGRWGTPDDVGSLAGYLLGQESFFITGQVLTIDGGQTISSPGTVHD
jgi:NAD(P)-dependent dehydrogenase (short-subunit alcohol dehydrogenase family)